MVGGPGATGQPVPFLKGIVAKGLVMQAFLGLAIFCLAAWAISENRKVVEWRVLGLGLALQIVLGVVLLKAPGVRDALLYLNVVVIAIRDATQAGTGLVFGYIGGSGFAPFEVVNPPGGVVLAFQALPILLVMSALSSLLFYWKILPLVVRGFSWLLQKTLDVGGAVGVSAAANVFVGMVEAPLFIRPYMNRLSRSELFTTMTVGMATIAGTMMVLYAQILEPVLGEQALGQLLAASIISAPAAIVISRLMIPETGAKTMGEMVEPHPAQSSMDAITHGALEGLKLWLNIIVMLIVLVALVSLINQMLAVIPVSVGVGETSAPISLQWLLGCVMAPLVWLMGVPWSDAFQAGQLMGIKTILNEFLAYLELARPGVGETLSPGARLIMIYAMCGFANLGSLGIMIGGLGTMVPERRAEIVGLGLRSIVAGTLSTMMTGAVVGIVVATVGV